MLFKDLGWKLRALWFHILAENIGKPEIVTWVENIGNTPIISAFSEIISYYK